MLYFVTKRKYVFNIIIIMIGQTVDFVVSENIVIKYKIGLFYASISDMRELAVIV